MLPTVKIGNKDVTRLSIGGNPFSGNSHVSPELDWEMTRYYTMPRLQAALDECWRQGINTCQSRGDRHQTRMYLEHRENRGQLQWIVQTATELSDIKNNIRDVARFGPIAIYNHGTHTDNAWHSGKIKNIREIVKWIKDKGLLAGVGSHVPEVIQYMEDKGWETDFYMCCFYNLARGFKTAPFAEQNAYAREQYPAGDPARMCETIRRVKKPCIAFKILAASRACKTPETVRAAIQFALHNIKPTDIVNVGVFQRDKNQIAENAQTVREILSAKNGLG